MPEIRIRCSRSLAPIVAVELRRWDSLGDCYLETWGLTWIAGQVWSGGLETWPDGNWVYRLWRLWAWYSPAEREGY